MSPAFPFHGLISHGLLSANTYLSFLNLPSAALPGLAELLGTFNKPVALVASSLSFGSSVSFITVEHDFRCNEDRMGKLYVYNKLNLPVIAE